MSNPSANSSAASSSAVVASANADLSWLPSDADEQLSLSFRIISNAYRTRVNVLEAELRAAKAQIVDKSEQFTALQKKSSALEVQLIESTQRANQIAEENRKLVAAVHKLQKDNNRLESLKKAVLNSIQDDHSPEDEDAHKVYCAEDILQKSAPRTMQELSGHVSGSDYLPSSWNFPSLGSSASLVDGNTSPQHSGGLPNGSIDHNGSGDNRIVDGKAFFRAARSVLTTEQFNMFLNDIKKLNQHRITREEALKSAQQIFGEHGADLYKDFKTMLARHL